MRLLNRVWFVPARHADEAFHDAPLHIAEMNFNVSAPHMYAICLEALNTPPGARFLDVGR